MHRLGRTACALLVLLSLRAHAETTGFDQALAAQVFTAAFGFMLPRTLDPVTLPQMTAWGLRGLTALDPNIVPAISPAEIDLTDQGRTLVALKPPAQDDLAGWGALVASIGATAARHSEALRRAGTQGIITSFFEEVFNHLDPYSRYVPPAAAQADISYRHGAAGVGASLGGRRGDLVLRDVVPQGPAARAGLHDGDRILAIEGTPATALDPASALAILNGEEATEVTLTARLHGGPRAVRLTRALVPADTVTVSRDHDALLIRVEGFTASTADLLRAAIIDAAGRAPHPRGIVLDLRGNRGGLLRQAVDVANLLLTGGVIATTAGRDPQANHKWIADLTDLAQGLPVIVLVDGRSASAAEILAAALSDNGRAVIVGSTTLGKGLVQTIGAMPDGGELFITWSRVLAPAGWPLQGLGVMPQICTSLGAEITQQQLDALNTGQQTMAKVLRTHRRARPGLPVAEMLAIRNACPADLGHDSDVSAAEFLIANPVAYASALTPN